jgi:hypothetical protein
MDRRLATHAGCSFGDSPQTWDLATLQAFHYSFLGLIGKRPLDFQPFAAGRSNQAGLKWQRRGL